jgi:hypothetical protein
MIADSHRGQGLFVCLRQLAESAGSGHLDDRSD